MKERNVFIIGSKGIPAQYGGFETFVDRLTYYCQNTPIKFHVSCLVHSSDNRKEYVHNGARCFCIPVSYIGPSRAVLYDIRALQLSLRYIREHKIEKPIIYILACRIGPVIGYYKKEIEKLGGTLLLNPDGHEWKRAKWNYWIKKYWKFSERLMVKNADLIICDSKNIEAYIREEYAKYQPDTRFVSYGAELEPSALTMKDESVRKWYKKFKIKPNNYYLVVGRFVPENNYQFVIDEYMKTDVKKDLVLITNKVKSPFSKKLKSETEYNKDSRIKFVGTVYNQELLKIIRENAFAYIHGHEVGGTNPSLLEALGTTKINVLLDVGFNKEVAEEGALYWSKKEGDLKNVIQKLEYISEEETKRLETAAKARIKEHYNWKLISDTYKKLFLEEV